MNRIGKLLYFLQHTGKNIPKTPKVKINFYHMTFVLEGTFTYISDGKEYILSKNDALLMVPGSIRERLYIPDRVKYVIINYHSVKGCEVKNNIFFKNFVTPSVLSYLNACPCSLYVAEKNDNANPESNLLTQTILQNLSNCILIEFFNALKNEPKNPHVSNALKFINDNISSPLSLDDICRAIHLSKSYTTRIFKKEMNLTLSDYINQRKLEIAKSMLTNDDISLQNIATSLGYENYCYFSKIFKESYGLSPLNMKKEIEKNNY